MAVTTTQAVRKNETINKTINQGATQAQEPVYLYIDAQNPDDSKSMGVFKMGPEATKA